MLQRMHTSIVENTLFLPKRIRLTEQRSEVLCLKLTLRIIYSMYNISTKLVLMFYYKSVSTSTTLTSLTKPFYISTVIDVFSLSLAVLAHWLLSRQTEWLEISRASLQKFIPTPLKYAFRFKSLCVLGFHCVKRFCLFLYTVLLA